LTKSADYDKVQVMEKELMEGRLHFHNPWWQSNQVPGSLTPKFKRQIYKKLLSYLKLDRIIVLKGPRRTGKSTLIYQLIEYLLKQNNTPAENILYLTFDDPTIRVDFFEIMKMYENISKSPFDKGDFKYVFLDEVQFLPNWASTIKMFYDKKLKIKLFVSGSAASLLIKQSESLAGRTIEDVVLPLSFFEWKEYHSNLNLVTNISDEVLFKRYMDKSGFLHLLAIDDKEMWTRMLTEDVVTKAIYKDSVEIFGLREPAVLEKLFSYLSAASSGLVNLVKLSSMLGIDRIQLRKYLSYLENTLLIFPLGKFSKQIRETIRSQEKIHLIDQGFFHIYQTPKDFAFETIVARHIWEKFPHNTYFWRDRQEVDIVVEKGKNLHPIEVKNTTSASRKDLLGIVSFCRKYKCKQGTVVYRGIKDKQMIAGINIEFYPVWEALINVEKIFPDTPAH